MNIDIRNTFFSQVDLSEYFENIKTKATATAQQNIR